MNLNQDKSSGPDNVSALMLKKLSNAFSVRISRILIKSYQKGQLPKAWKTAKVSPLHKVGSKLDIKNYRPVSLTSIVGKIMERLLREEILVYLINNK